MKLIRRISVPVAFEQATKNTNRSLELENLAKRVVQDPGLLVVGLQKRIKVGSPSSTKVTVSVDYAVLEDLKALSDKTLLPVDQIIRLAAEESM